MIDWVSMFLPYKGPDICGGSVLVIDPNGEVKSETLRFLEVDAPSSCDKTRVKTMPGGLYVSGNPSKWLQGHNVFGTDDLRLLVERWGKSVLSSININDLSTYKALNQGNYRKTRVDINYLFELKDKSECHQWIQAANLYCQGKYQKTEIDKGTLYVGRHSKRLSWKIYYKGDEIVKNKPSITNDYDLKLLKDFCENKLRFELTLRSPALQDYGLEYGLNWCCCGKSEFCGGTAEKVFNLRISKLNLTGSYQVNSEELKLLPRKYQSVYQLWVTGANMKELYAKNTFYKYKRFFLHNYGIDIGIQKISDRGQVIPLIRAIEARPTSIPEWAYDRGLIVV